MLCIPHTLIAVSWLPIQQNSVRCPCPSTEVRCLITHIKQLLHREPEVWSFSTSTLVFTQNTQLSSACGQTYSDLIQTMQSDSGGIFTPSVTMEVWDTKGVVRWGRGKCWKQKTREEIFFWSCVFNGVGVYAMLPVLCLHLSEPLTPRSVLQQRVEEDNN